MSPMSRGRWRKRRGVSARDFPDFGDAAIPASLRPRACGGRFRFLLEAALPAPPLVLSNIMASPRRSPPLLEARGTRFLIVEARYYEDIAAMLLEGAKTALAKAGASFDLVSVPGALEIPLALTIALDHAEVSKRPFDGAVALGCVIRGETHHFEIVANESARALMQVSLARKLAFGNGVLTVENEAQALTRANPRQGDKGGDAARAALSIHRLKFAIGAS
jgi:6,7-dimethyl-8-ribityllumazine synthase